MFTDNHLIATYCQLIHANIISTAVYVYQSKVLLSTYMYISLFCLISVC